MAAFWDVSASTVHTTLVWWFASVEVCEGWNVPGGKEFRAVANVVCTDMAVFLHRLAG